MTVVSVSVFAVVEGMSCGSCAAHLESKLKAAQCASERTTTDSVQVNFATKQANVDFTVTSTNSTADMALLREQCETFVTEGITAAGYKVVSIRARANQRGIGSVAESEVPERLAVKVAAMIEGMSCGSCAAHLNDEIQRTLSKGHIALLPELHLEVRDAAVNFATKLLQMQITCSSPNSTVSLPPLAETESAIRSWITSCVQAAGYQVATLNVSFPHVARINESNRQWCAFTLLIRGSIELDDCSKLCAGVAQRVKVLCPEMRVPPSIPSVDLHSNTLCVPLASTASVGSAAAVGISESEALTVVWEVINMLKSKEWGFTDVELHSRKMAADDELTTMMSDVGENQRALERSEEIHHQRRRLLGSFVFTLPIVVVMVASMAIDRSKGSAAAKWLQGHRCWIHVSELILATPVVVWFGGDFFIKAAKGLKHRSFTMDTLVSVGIGSAYLFSCLSLVITYAAGIHMVVYFDAAATLTTFMLLGRFLEAIAKRHTSGALIGLMRVVPRSARLVVNGREEQYITVPCSVLAVGHEFRVLPGDSVPADGVVIAGISDVDEQMITGESVPRTVRPGDTVTGGTVNQSSALTVRASRVGDDTTLSNILRIVQDAQSTKPSIQRVADRIAGYFVPAVVSYAFLTLTVWMIVGASSAYPSSWREPNESFFVFAFSFFVATVVVACPCALGLATPTAVMVGTGVGATNGVLIKSGAMLEVASSIECIVFDKTGTLTNGHLNVVACESSFGSTTQLGSVPEDVIRLAVAAVEAESRHPIAKSIAAFLQQKQQPSAATSSCRVVETNVHPGYGVTSRVVVTVDGAPQQELRVAVGSIKMMSFAVDSEVPDFGVEAPSDALRLRAHRMGLDGLTTVVAAVNGHCVMLFGLSDCPKPEAAGVVAYLKHCLNMRVVMVTGDHRNVALHIGALVGIPQSDTWSDVLPQGKAAIVQQLQNSGSVRVAFVGDGINDSPALAQADVGVALGAGTDIAIEAADAVLMRSSLSDLCNFILLARTTVRRIKFNFVWAFGYNLIMLPVASGVFFPWWRYQLSPILAGMAMVCSSLSVLASSLLLRCFSPPSAGYLSRYGGGRKSLGTDDDSEHTKLLSVNSS